MYVSVPSFTTQPTEENLYTVAFNHPDATLQWCEKTVFDSATYTEDEDPAVVYEVNAGDALIVSLSECSDDFTVFFGCSYNEEALSMPLNSSRKTASVTFDSACSVAVNFMPSPLGNGEYKIEHVRWTELEGETGVQLSKTECETTYVCKATVGEREYCSDEVTIEQEHSYTCTHTSDNVITKKCDTCGKSGTLTIEAEDGIYDGTTAYGATVEKTGIFENEEVIVNYYQGDTLIGTDAPVNAGTYTAKITYEEEVTVYDEFEITKANTVITWNDQTLASTGEEAELTAPTLTFIGNDNPEVVLAYSYKVQGDAEYTAGLPSDCGIYDVKVNVSETDNYNAVEDTIILTITCTPNADDGDCTTAITCSVCGKVTTEAGHVDANSDGKCDVCGLFTDGIGANLAGYTISLNGNIGVNFYMELDTEVVGDTGAYMLFTLPNGDTEQVAIADATQNTTLVEGKTYYIFSCEVASYEMAQSIKAQMFDGNGNGGKEYSYTVRDYAEYIINNTASYSTDDVAFAKALLNYGACSQTYFEVETGNLANKNLDEADQTVTTLIASDLETYKVSATSNELGTFAGYSLTLKSETTLKAYFKPAEGVDVSNLTFTANGQTVTPTKSGDYYVLSLENIKAWDLDTSYAFKVSNGSVELEFSCSALSYGYSVLNKGNSTYPDTLIQLISALRVYQQKSEVYVSGNN